MRHPAHRGWPYVLHVPLGYDGAEPFPLVVYLAGNDGSAVEGALIGERGLGDREFLVLYPHGAGRWWHEAPTRVVDAVLTEVLQRYNVDPDRIYLAGLSNGGTGAYYFAARWPHRFTAAVSAMGAGQFAPYLAAGRLPPSPENLAHLSVLFLHGARDRTIPGSLSRETLELLRRADRTAPAEYHRFPNRGHGIVPGRGDDGRTLAFFRRFEERSRPDRVRFRLRQPPAGRQYWLRVFPSPGAAAAQVEGEVRSGGRVELGTRVVARVQLLLSPVRFPTGERLRVRWNGDRVFDDRVPADCDLLERSYREEGDPHLAVTGVVTLSRP